jgi:hypothetical protein
MTGRLTCVRKVTLAMDIENLLVASTSKDRLKRDRLPEF